MRSRSDLRASRFAALVAGAVAVLWFAAGGATAAELVVVAALPPTADRNVSLVVDTGAATVKPDSLAVTVDGVSQPAAAAPVVSVDLSVGIVVDASQDGGATLPAWLSGAARFVLEAPAGSRATVVADTAPPSVVAPLGEGSTDLVRALSGVQPRGQRRTAEAVTLALRQLATAPAGPHVVLLYTSAPDAGGEPAADLGRRLAEAQTLLVVVSTAPETGYWTEATRATGGFLAPARPPAVAPAMDQVSTLLRARYLVTFPAPGQLPARATVRVDTADGPLSADAVVPAPSDPPRAVAHRDDRATNVVLAVLLVACAVVVGAAILVLPRRFRRSR